MAAAGPESKDDAGGSAGRIFLHPLPLVSIAEHQARHENGGGKGSSRVIGVLFGHQEGLDIHIAHSYELVVQPDGTTVDIAFLAARRELITTVFPSYEVIGLYSTEARGEADLALMETMADFNASLFLVLDPTADEDTKELPITLYRREVVLREDRARSVMVPVQFDIDSTEPERVVVDHLSKVSGQVQGQSTLVSNLKAVKDAVQALSERVGVLREFVRATQRGEIPRDHRLLRQVGAICAMLPAIDGDSFNAEFLAEHNDSLLVTYLSTVTKTLCDINESMKKAQVATSDVGRGGRGAPLGPGHTSRRVTPRQASREK